MSTPAKQHPVFLNAGIGKWYSLGSERLKGSLIGVGAPVEHRFWIDQWPDSHTPRDVVYNIKGAAFDAAIKEGYRILIWGDSSVYAVKKIEPFLDVIRIKGYWLGQSGHNAAQTCSDACLKYFGITRDEAEKIHDCATGLFAVNLDFDAPRRFIERFIKAGREGAFHGSRLHAGQSADPRFLYARQDQSAATIIAAQEGMKLDSWQDFVAFKWDAVTHHIFKCEGM